MLTSSQQEVARIALQAVRDHGFVLAGGAALIAHGLVDRETRDLDLFGEPAAAEQTSTVLDAVRAALSGVGHRVEETRRSLGYGRLVVDDIEIDVAVDWRAHEPVDGPFGAMLDIRDSVGNKVATAFSRGERRDIEDYFAIRASNRWSDAELVDLARERDEGFDYQVLEQNVQRFLELERRRKPSEPEPSGGGVWVRPHLRRGRLVHGHWRKSRG